tara:strand:+ start:751 stop:1482 length:732 start_codon:yes stop_codon:yes gene_type:complete
MRIDRVILSSNESKKYLDFWPIVSSAWKQIGVEPTLIYTGKKELSNNNENILNFYIKGINSAFVAQNIRLLAPSLFPDDVCLISDIDNMPLSKSYFLENIIDVKDNNFVIFRPSAASENMISIMWNAALGSTWSEIFQVKDRRDIEERIRKWYPGKYKVGGKNWYFDQIILKEYLINFKHKSPNRIYKLDDKESGFLRLNRSKLKDSKKFYDENLAYSDFHMPRPYRKHKKLIDFVYNRNFKK